MASKSGLGSCTLWGLTPALNLLTFLDDNTLIEADDNEKAINILLLGQSDCRHLFRTMEEHLNVGTTKQVKINVYIVENNIELYARQLCFMTLACEPLEEIGLYEKTRQFMEILGNTYLRPRTQATLIRLAKELVKMVTDDDYFAHKLPFLHISELKFRERDSLVEIFKYWADYCDSRKEDLVEKWDKRLRYHLGTRYDSRVRIFDWDYHMRLQEMDAKIISAGEYKNWRGTGMAFVDLDSDYSQPNVTLMSGASSTTDLKNVCYLGEIVTGPFIGYGIECDDKSMFEKANDKFKNISGDITQLNLEKTLSTISKTKVKNQNIQNSDNGSGDVKAAVVGDSKERNLSDIFSVHFLPMESAKYIQLKSQFHNKFQLVYFSSTMAQNLTPEIAKVFAPEAVVIVEGVRYTLELRKEHVKAYEDKLKELAAKVNYSRCPDDSESYHADYLTFVSKNLQTTVEEDDENKQEKDIENLEVIEVKPASSKCSSSKSTGGKEFKNIDKDLRDDDDDDPEVDEGQTGNESNKQTVYCSDSDDSIKISDSSDLSREPSIVSLNLNKTTD